MANTFITKRINVGQSMLLYNLPVKYIARQVLSVSLLNTITESELAAH